MNKRGQIFILAAVIISVIVLGMATVTNYVRVTEEPDDFYDYSENLRYAANDVIDYEIRRYNTEDELEEFVQIMVENIRDKDSEASFMFIYGSKTEGLIIENYGADVAKVATDSGIIEGEGFPTTIEPGNLIIESEISYGSSYTTVNENYDYLGGTGARATYDDSALIDAEEIKITILNNEYNFPITEERRIIFIIQKEDGEESYVSV